MTIPGVPALNFAAWAITAGPNRQVRVSPASDFMITLLRRPSTPCSVPRTLLWTRAGSGEACAAANGGAPRKRASRKDEAESALVQDQCMSLSPGGRPAPRRRCAGYHRYEWRKRGSRAWSTMPARYSRDRSQAGRAGKRALGRAEPNPCADLGQRASRGDPSRGGALGRVLLPRDAVIGH